MATRVLLADDHTIVRQGLRILLQREGFEVVGEAANGVEAVRLATETVPDVVVLDYGMPVMNGLAAAREIMATCPRAKLILLTMHADDRYVLEAVRLGVKGYVVKSQAPTDLVRAIHEVLNGMMYLSPRVSRTVVQAYLAKSELPPDPLTPREREVLQLVAAGKTTKEVAELLGISVKTAESHRTHIMQKVDTSNTAAAQDATKRPPAPAAAAPAAAPAAATPAPATGGIPVGPEYKIGIDDVLDIAVWNNTTVSRTVPVRPDSKITLPLINEVQAAGLTPSQLRAALMAKLVEYMPTPELSVIVREVHSNKISVLGEVRKAGRYEITQRATVLDAVALAGGFNDWARRSKLVIMRQEGNGVKRIPVNYNRIVAEEDENVILQPGDIVVVP